MPQVSTVAVCATLAGMLDLPYEEVKFDLDVQLERCDDQLSREIDRYLEFIDLNRS